MINFRLCESVYLTSIMQESNLGQVSEVKLHVENHNYTLNPARIAFCWNSKQYFSLMASWLFFFSCKMKQRGKCVKHTFQFCPSVVGVFKGTCQRREPALTRVQYQLPSIMHENGKLR